MTTALGLQLESRDFVEGTFEPADRATLKPCAAPFIGRRGIFQTLWIGEPHEHQPGEWRLQIPRDWQVEVDAAGQATPHDWLDPETWFTFVSASELVDARLIDGEERERVRVAWWAAERQRW